MLKVQYYYGHIHFKKGIEAKQIKLPKETAFIFNINYIKNRNPDHLHFFDHLFQYYLLKR